MHAPTKTPGEYYGHIDGAAAAERGTEMFPDRAFERRLYTSRLDESDRGEYERAWFEAFHAQAALRTGLRVVETGGMR